MQHATYSARPFHDADLDTVVELINTCEAIDQLDQGTSPVELREFFADPDVDPARDFQLWEGADGQLAGCGQLLIDEPDGRVEGRLRIYVHPAARDGALGDQILAWGAERMRQLGRERGQPAGIRSLGRDDIPYRLDLVQRNGFVAQRSFLRMARALDTDLPQPPLPDGFVARPLAGEREAEAWAKLFNETFRDHWNHHDYTVGDVWFWLGDPSYRPDLNLVAVAPDGRPAAFCWGSVKEKDGVVEGWIDELGTHPDYRRLGLGQAMLLRVLGRMRATGIGIAKLGVDADNPASARHLYAATGFTVLFRMITSFRQL